MYAKDLSEAKYEYLIKKHENAGIKDLNDPNALIECSNTVDGVYKNINDYNPRRKRKKLTVFGDIIATLRVTKNFKAFRLLLSRSLIFLFQKM